MTTIAQQRVHNQRLAGQRFGRAAEVVRWLGAVQAQDYYQALWAIGSRTAGAAKTDIEQAIADREIVLTWPMRGTLHYVPAADAKWMLNLLGPRRATIEQRMLSQFGIDKTDLARAADTFSAALTGGRRLTRAAMMQALDDAGISPQGQRGYHLLGYFARAGLICFGPREGKEQTFVLLDEWVPRPRHLPREDALAELAGRYIMSHGPATPRDFAHWTGLTLTDARAGFATARGSFVHEVHDNQTYWRSANAPEPVSGEVAKALLVAGFDEYLLGYKDRSAMLPPTDAARVSPGGNGIFLPLIVVNGQVIGTWKRVIKRRGIDISIKPFRAPAVTAGDLAPAAQRYRHFTGMPLLDLTIEPV